MIQILLSTDNNYVMPTGVLMHSIGENNTTSIAYHIFINESFDAKNRNLLSDIAGRYGSDVNFYTITEETTKDFPLSGDNRPDHITMASYYRLFAADVLPDNLDKVLYLDGDMIVRKPLDELWNTDIEGYAVGVVEVQDYEKGVSDTMGWAIEKAHYLPYDVDLGYFNAGVLLINLNFWRQNKVRCSFDKFIAEKNDIVIFHDQDVLNTVFCKSKKVLHLGYNLDHIILGNGYIGLHGDNINYENFVDPTVIHYTGNAKPWHKDCTSPFKDVWLQYLEISQWSGMKLRRKGPSPFCLSDIMYLFKMPGLPKRTKVKYWKIVIGNYLTMLGVGRRDWRDNYTEIKRRMRSYDSDLWRGVLKH